MSMTDARLPGVLSSKEILVAEAIQARAWIALDYDGCPGGEQATSDKAKLGAIVLRLMSDRTKSIGDLTSAAVEAFKSQ